ncbi:MAG: hypothetical protein ABSF34_03020 [Verrucomicrobiota bacterium]
MATRQRLKNHFPVTNLSFFLKDLAFSTVLVGVNIRVVPPVGGAAVSM